MWPRIGKRQNFEDVTLIQFSLKPGESMPSPLGKRRGDVFKYVLNFKPLSNFTEASVVLFACLELRMGLMGFISTLQSWA